MSNPEPGPPTSFGIEALTRLVADFRDHLDKTLSHLRQEIRAGENRLERAVKAIPTRQEFDAAKQALGQAINDAATRVQNDIQALRDQLAAGNPITDQDLVDIQNDLGLVGAIDPAVIPPPPGP
jgi:hypothetical protein